jgi:hypothetical protein
MERSMTAKVALFLIAVLPSCLPSSHPVLERLAPTRSTLVGKNIDLWGATLTTRKEKGGDFQRHAVILIYDKERPDGEKNKNGNTGRMAMRELVDPERNGSKGISRLHEIVGDANHGIATGDTGNGIRGLPQCWFYTTFKRLYGLTMEQIILPPRHAFNHTDRLLARLNTFFSKLMRLVFLLGSRAFFNALSTATNPRMTGPLHLVKRCTVIFCDFKVAEFIPVPKLVQSIMPATGTQPIGVMSLGYFLCTVSKCGGEGDETMEGVMRVAKYGDLTKAEADNPVMVFDMLRKSGCQRCSNRAVRRRFSEHTSLQRHIQFCPIFFAQFSLPQFRLRLVFAGRHLFTDSVLPLGAANLQGHTRVHGSEVRRGLASNDVLDCLFTWVRCQGHSVSKHKSATSKKDKPKAKHKKKPAKTIESGLPYDVAWM